MAFAPWVLPNNCAHQKLPGNRINPQKQAGNGKNLFLRLFRYGKRYMLGMDAFIWTYSALNCFKKYIPIVGYYGVKFVTFWVEILQLLAIFIYVKN